MDDSIKTSKTVIKYILYAVLLVLAGLYIPFAAIITSVVWFIPLIILAVEKGYKYSLIGIMSIALVLALISSETDAFIFISGQGIIALVYCMFFSKKASFRKLLLGGLAAALVSAVLRILIMIWVLGFSYAKWLTEMRKVADSIIQLYKESGVWEQLTSGPFTEQEFQKMLYNFSETVVNLTPATLITFAMLVSFIGLLLAIRFLRKKGLWSPEVPSFSMWKLPWLLAWPAILGLSSLLLGDYLTNKVLLVVGQNLVYILAPIYIVSGLATASFYYKKIASSFLMKMAVLVIIVFNFPLLLVLLLILGVFDPLIDFRRLSKLK